MFAITLAKLSFFVSFTADTITVESTILDNITESVTNSHGVPSIIIISHTSFSSSNKWFICGDINNSDGFGGIFPAGITNKLLIGVVCIYSVISFSSPSSKSIPDR